MADVRIRVAGMRDVNATSYPVAYQEYVDLANDNGLTIPKSGWVIQDWTANSEGSQAPIRVVFMLDITVPEAQIQTVWNQWKALSEHATKGFTRLPAQVAVAIVAT